MITDKGRVPVKIFTKFTGFMRVLSVHNRAKFGCFISIIDKIINNLLRWVHSVISTKLFLVCVNFVKIVQGIHKGRVPCTIFTKFTGFMRVLCLHNFAKVGCFISINDKIINNLLCFQRFQPNFRRPLAAKLLVGPKNVFDLK